MILTEYNEAEVMDYIRQEAIEEGLAEGREQGLAEGREQGLEQGLEQGRAAQRAETLEKVIQLYKAGAMDMQMVKALGFDESDLADDS